MAEKSALRLIPGKDALLQYSPAVYAPTTYVEYQGKVYKSLVTTSPTFVPSEWELISDPRTPRVPNIASRNALTGSTPTSGTTGIVIPILDNTDVLVLNAYADPQVAANKFAIYNYNKGTNSFLLLQVSTGSTSSNVSDYNLLTNKPPIISGITAQAGAAIVGGGVFSGGVPPTRATFSFAHADTSSQANINATGLTYVQKLKFDTYGHTTGATTSAWVHPIVSTQPTVNNTGYTYIQSVQLNNGHVQVLGSSTWVHPDTSNQGSVINTGNNVIQSIGVDGDGHITGISSTLISGGGGGVNFNVAGNSGGSFSMPNTGTLQITGGTNISTLSSLNGGNLGVRVNFVPAGSNNQVQINSSGALSASGNLTFTGGTTLVVNKLTLTGTPATGNTINDFMLRNVASGAINRMSFNTLKSNLIGQPVNSIQFNGVGTFSGSSNFIWQNPLQALTVGTRNVGTVGLNSSSIGTGNIASGATSFVVGVNSIAGLDAIALGNTVSATGQYSFASGINTIASNTGSVAFGSSTKSAGNLSFASGYVANAMGDYSFAGGQGNYPTKPILASGATSFNFSYNNNLQVIGHGALAPQSAILGGLNNNIAVGNVGAAIIGGNTINLTGSTYSYTTAVGNLAIMSTPSFGVSTNNVLVRDTNGVTKQVTQASLSNASNGLTKNLSNNYITLGGFLTGNTTVSLGTYSMTIGSRVFGKPIGQTSVVIGTSNVASGTSSIAMGNTAIAGGSSSFSINGTATGQGSIALGSYFGTPSIATGAFSTAIAGGKALNTSSFGANSGNASGIGAVAFGGNATGSTSVAFYGNAYGNTSFAISSGVARGTQSFAGSTAIATGYSSMAFGYQANAWGSNSVCLGGSPSTQFYGYATGILSFAFGNALASGNGSVAFGSGTGVIFDYTTKATGNNSVAFNYGVASGGNSFAANTGKAVGSSSTAFSSGIATGTTSIALGGAFVRDINYTTTTLYAKSLGNYSFATHGGKASGDHSIAMGCSGDLTSFDALTGSTASGIGSFAVMGAVASGRHSIGLGYWGNAGAQYSGVFGGSYNTINAGSQGSVILGGNSINLGATNYLYHAITSNLAIFTTPTTSVGSDNVLAWNSTDKKVKLGTISSTSDIRLKTDFKPLVNVVDKISQLDTYEYTNNDVIEPMKGVKNYGLTAQQVEEVFPHVVKDNYEWNEETYKTVDYRHLVPVLFAAIKELNDKIKDLESKIK